MKVTRFNTTRFAPSRGKYQYEKHLCWTMCGFLGKRYTKCKYRILWSPTSSVETSWHFSNVSCLHETCSKGRPFHYSKSSLCQWNFTYLSIFHHRKLSVTKASIYKLIPISSYQIQYEIIYDKHTGAHSNPKGLRKPRTCGPPVLIKPNQEKWEECNSFYWKSQTRF